MLVLDSFKNFNKMKNYLILSFVFLLGISSQAQVAIGKETVDGAAILDFASGATSGIILPVVTTLPTGSGATNGTILINAANSSEAKAQMRVNDTWVDISDSPRDISALTLNTTPDIGSGAIIGAQSSAASGVLVLEATDKALVLPKVANAVTDVKSPVAGSMVYDLSSKSVAIYDGVKWNFWK